MEERPEDPTHNIGHLPEVPTKGTLHALALVSFPAAEAHSRSIQMLQFYERHVRIIKRDPDAESAEAEISQ